MKDRPSKLARLGCALVAAVIALCVVGVVVIGGPTGLLVLLDGRNPIGYVSPTPTRVAETRARAEEIVAALGRWQAKHGEFPLSLGELVPSELPALQRPTVGDRKWTYSRPERNRFILDFWEGPMYEHSWWDSDARQWQGDH